MKKLLFFLLMGLVVAPSISSATEISKCNTHVTLCDDSINSHLNEEALQSDGKLLRLVARCNGPRWVEYVPLLIDKNCAVTPISVETSHGLDTSLQCEGVGVEGSVVHCGTERADYTYDLKGKMLHRRGTR